MFVVFKTNHRLTWKHRELLNDIFFKLTFANMKLQSAKKETTPIVIEGFYIEIKLIWSKPIKQVWKLVERSGTCSIKGETYKEYSDWFAPKYVHGQKEEWVTVIGWRLAELANNSGQFKPSYPRSVWWRSTNT